ncbi:hypothetical protein [Clostridium intestinale]|uniref:Uncharacterized protein n=1 Tax=Clostridium intestinale DSM 6191 TaxID=1121320 RepID=A0A1M5THE2_9CLOT|nr:hypothetical protein [Clostridium intestinale]WRY52629.1 hypothetical protein P8F83_05385 [Clostridium intestinale]SHH50109.1 hypothetical protein SAMN02745941_00215 [Clostridium intestinale DSM 6191]
MNNNVNQEIKEVNQVPEQSKLIDPSKDLGNYVVQIIGEDGKSVLKQLIANKCTVKISSLGEGSICAEIK